MSPTDIPTVAITCMDERSLGDRSKTTSFIEQNRRISSGKKLSEKAAKHAVVPVAVVTIANLPSQQLVQHTMPFNSVVDHSISFAAAAESCQGGMTAEATMDQEGGNQKDKTPDRLAEQ